MERIEPDQTPSQAWKANLDATCNRLMSHYLSLLRAGTSDAAVDGDDDGAADLGHDSRAGGGNMQSLEDPPPPLAASVSLNSVQAKLAAENLCVAASNALDLIRTLRLSALMLDEEAIRAEEEEEALEAMGVGLAAEEECVALEGRLVELRNKELD
ncbi:hypothetical protein ACHAXN_009397 [Cyclotella atomus]